MMHSLCRIIERILVGANGNGNGQHTKKAFQVSHSLTIALVTNNNSQAKPGQARPTGLNDGISGHDQILMSYTL